MNALLPFPLWPCLSSNLDGLFFVLSYFILDYCKSRNVSEVIAQMEKSGAIAVMLWGHIEKLEKLNTRPQLKVFKRAQSLTFEGQREAMCLLGQSLNEVCKLC